MYEIIFYSDKNGREPVADYMQELGKSKTKDLNTHSESYLEEKEYSTFETANRYDLGFRIGCGYDFNKHIEFAVNYTLGMNRFSNTANYRWRGWNLHLVVFF